MNDEASCHESSLDPVEAIVVSSPRAKKPQDVTDDLRRLIHWLYTNNPFYVLSAALVFVGLWTSFDASGSASAAKALAASLAIYTLLLAFTAWFLIRFGNLWQDVRTLLILIVLMFLGISVSCDRPILRAVLDDAEWGVGLSIAGLAFAIVVSEALLRGIRLRLPLGYRLPYHAILALFFLYPVALRPWVGDRYSEALRWGLFGFSMLAGVLFLTLVPAIRRGAAYVADNGSPWLWPWYPWVLFVVLGLGVCLRANYLCISLHGVTGDQTIFGFYFLAPFLWAVAYLLLEAWAVSGQIWVQQLAVSLPLVMVVIALSPSPSQAQDWGFLAMFHGRLATSPLFLALLAATAFYLIAWLRGAREAFWPGLLAVAALAFCGPNTFNPSTTWGPHGVPFLLAGIALLLAGAWRKSAASCLLGAWCVVLMLWIDFRATPFAACHGAIPLHLLLICGLVVGAVFRNAVGKMIQTLGAFVLLDLALAASLLPPSALGNPPPVLLTVYPLSVAALAAAYGFFCKNPWYYASVFGSLCGWIVVPGWTLFCQARRAIVGLDYIAAGIASFLLAFLMSLMKMGFLRRLYDRWRGKK
jgi:hypothetical protein